MEGGPPGIMGLNMPGRHSHQQHQHQRQLLPFSIAQPNDAPFPGVAYGGAKQQLSPEEEPRGFGDQDAARRGASPSPWQRMKWTDGMVRLLIMVVYSMGDADAAEPDHPPASSSSSAASAKARKGAAAQQQQQQQRKGKWKSVSRAMMEKGFFVSPQQCEDKFNDLNKRYKRVNDLLGKGTACRVVENQALLDTMDHLSSKAKDEARKLLNSKHLFFREMCAYHNAGATAAAATATTTCTPLSSAPPHHHHPTLPPPPPPQLQPHAICFHHEDADSEEEEELDDDDDDDDEDDPYDDDEDEVGNHRAAAAAAASKKRSHHHHHEDENYNEDDDEDSKGLVATASASSAPKRGPQPSSSVSPPLSLSLWPPPPTSLQQFNAQLAGLMGRDHQQQRQWLKRKASELEEQRVGYQGRALQLERQRLKWLRFSGNKEREMERLKMENDRLRLENDRMMLLLRHKELDLTTTPQMHNNNDNNNSH